MNTYTLRINETILQISQGNLEGVLIIIAAIAVMIGLLVAALCERSQTIGRKAGFISGKRSGIYEGKRLVEETSRKELRTTFEDGYKKGYREASVEFRSLIIETLEDCLTVLRSQNGVQSTPTEQGEGNEDVTSHAIDEIVFLTDVTEN